MFSKNRSKEDFLLNLGYYTINRIFFILVVVHVVLYCEIVKDHLCNLATIHSALVILCICLILDFYFKFIFMFLKYVCLFAIQGILHGTLWFVL